MSSERSPTYRQGMELINAIHDGCAVMMVARDDLFAIVHSMRMLGLDRAADIIADLAETLVPAVERIRNANSNQVSANIATAEATHVEVVKAMMHLVSKNGKDPSHVD